jgi:DegV family protein with EDD domain
MAIKVVSDSGADLPAVLLQELNISTVPVYIYFGEKAYKDGIDIGPDELYERLVKGPVHPTTTQPMPVDFADLYKKLAPDYDEIISVHLSSKVSGTVNSALQGREMAGVKSRIEVIDSKGVSMAVGLLAVAAARMVRNGADFSSILTEVNKMVEKVRLYGVLDTLKYLLAGGRITKAKAAIGGLLNVKPILTMKDGEIVQYGMERNYARGMAKLCKLVKNAGNIEEMAIIQSTVLEKANELKKMIMEFLPEERIIMARLGAGLGVHGGPGTLIVTVRSS